jgi:hypothetical protein
VRVRVREMHDTCRRDRLPRLRRCCTATVHALASATSKHTPHTHRDIVRADLEPRCAHVEQRALSGSHLVCTMMRVCACTVRTHAHTHVGTELRVTARSRRRTAVPLACSDSYSVRVSDRTARTLPWQPRQARAPGARTRPQRARADARVSRATQPARTRCDSVCCTSPTCGAVTTPAPSDGSSSSANLT